VYTLLEYTWQKKGLLMKHKSIKKPNSRQKKVVSKNVGSHTPIFTANLTTNSTNLILEIETSSPSPKIEFPNNESGILEMLHSLYSQNIRGVRLFGKKQECSLLAEKLLRNGVRPLITDRNEKTKKKIDKKLAGFPVFNQNVAGIDIGKSLLYVSVPQHLAEDHTRAFGTFTSDLEEIVSWLKSLNITEAAMESTSVYWIPLYDLLEHNGIKPIIVNPKHVKMLPGRKTDVLDAQWLMRLLSCRLAPAGFIPPLEIRALRDLSRHRQDLMDRAGDCLNRMHKMLSLMNIQLSCVISDISGKTGAAIIKAIISGDRDFERMAKLADKNCKSTPEEFVRALHGTYNEEHLFVLEQELEMYEIINRKIEETEKKIQEMLKKLPDAADLDSLPEPTRRQRKKSDYNRSPYCFDLRSMLHQKFGYDLTVFAGIDSPTAATIIFETGGKLDAFPTHKHFASWAGVCPGNKVSGGKRLSGKAPKKFSRVGQALRIAANSNHKADSAIGARLRGLMRRGKSKKTARKATANKLSFLVYNTMKYGQKYVEKGAEEYEKKYEERKIKSCIKTLESLGYDPSTIRKKAA
jgi:transposase